MGLALLRESAAIPRASAIIASRNSILLERCAGLSTKRAVSTSCRGAVALAAF